jgi:hypothetical protein
VNPFLQNLNRLEFLLTFACTGQCKHCSEGDHDTTGAHINGGVAADMVRKAAEKYRIESLMTFGGEPLLYPDEVCKIHAAAREAGVVRRQLITNGFFARSDEKIRRVAQALAKSGVTDILLSVDAFHQETIPLGPVMAFAKTVQALNFPRFRVHPAWLVGEDADNPYNSQTRKILARFNALGISSSRGNVIFPSGNALKYLREYFDLSIPHTSEYAQDPHDIEAICVIPNGDLLGGNMYETDILEILANYDPKKR